MKHYIYSLLAIMSAVSINSAIASECVGTDCEISTAVIEERVVVEPLIKIESKPTCEYDYNCPFETVEECAVWYKKPVYNQAVYPRAQHFSFMASEKILYAINSTSDFCANDKSAKPLLERYKMLSRAATSCCGAGIVKKMQDNGASEKDIYNFLKDDANYYAVVMRCLMTDNEGIAESYSYGVDGSMVEDVRNACLCKNKTWFNALLEPFKDIYKRAPQFKSMPFNYTYKDGMQRDITVSVNQDVQTTLYLLENCPK